MRIVFRSGVLLVICILLLTVWWSFEPGQEKVTGISESKRELSQVSKSSTYFQLVPDSWVSIRILPTWRILRAGFRVAVDTEPRDPLVFTVQYKMIDTLGNEVRSGEYSLKTLIQSITLQQNSGDIGTATYLGQSSELLSILTRMYLDLPEQDQIREVKLRLVEKETLVKNVFSQFHYRDTLPVSERESALFWARSSEEKRAEIVHGLALSEQYLTDQQRHLIYQQRWRRVAPEGIDGEDFFSQTVYSLSRELYSVNSGRGVGRYHLRTGNRAVIPVPEKSQVRISSGSGTSTSLSVRHYNEVFSIPVAQSRLVPAEGLLAFPVEPGLLVIESNDESTVDVVLVSDSTGEEIVDHRYVVRYSLCDSNQPLDYKIAHLPGKSTPFRLDLIALIAPHDTAPSFSVGYQLLNRSGGVLTDGVLKSRLLENRYDHHYNPEQPISQLVSWYAALDNSVDTVRLTCNDDTLISAYNRPPGLPHRKKIPEDTRSWIANPDAQPLWFRLAPEDWQERINEGRTNLVLRSPSVPDRDPRFLTGNYHWQALDGDGYIPKVSLYFPRTREYDSLPVRDAARGSLYARLKGCRDMEFISPDGKERLTPRLFYSRSSESGNIQISVDGKPYYHSRLHRQYGEQQLPSLPQGVHSVCVQDSSNDRSLFISHSRQPDDSRYEWKVLSAHPLRGDSMKYQLYYEGQPLTLGVRLYPENYVQGAAMLSVRLHFSRNSNQFYPSWTTDYYQFQLAEPVAIQGVDSSDWSGVSGVIRVSMPLGEDVSKGSVHVSISSNEHIRGYIQPYLTTPEDVNWVEFQ